MVAVKCNQLEEAQGLVGRMVESRTRRIEKNVLNLGGGGRLQNRANGGELEEVSVVMS
jgi:hypothetical protein